MTTGPTTFLEASERIRRITEGPTTLLEASERIRMATAGSSLSVSAAARIQHAGSGTASLSTTRALQPMQNPAPAYGSAAKALEVMRGPAYDSATKALEMMRGPASAYDSATKALEAMRGPASISDTVAKTTGLTPIAGADAIRELAALPRSGFADSLSGNAPNATCLSSIANAAGRIAAPGTMSDALRRHAAFSSMYGSSRRLGLPGSIVDSLTKTMGLTSVGGGTIADLLRKQGTFFSTYDAAWQTSLARLATSVGPGYATMVSGGSSLPPVAPTGPASEELLILEDGAASALLEWLSRRRPAIIEAERVCHSLALLHACLLVALFVGSVEVSNSVDGMDAFAVFLLEVVALALRQAAKRIEP